MRTQAGKVYLVGSGPGDAAYLTVQAQTLLTQAEVLVYDALVEGELLSLVPPNCLKLDVGKRGGQPSMPQAEINQLLVEQCQAGRQVVRLKSGDPLIFGRGMAEIQALKQAGCEFELVPGLSSALAAPLLAGIPLTDPVLSRCFAVLSAHEPSDLDWEALAQIDTLVILMGGRKLAEVLYQLQRQGRSPKTPIAIIRWAGHPQQQIWTGTLSTIITQTAGETLSPAVIIIGEVVRFQSYLSSPVTLPTASSAPSLPLRQMTVLVTRSASQSSQLTDRLQQAGAQVLEMPALEIGPPSSWVALDDAIAQLETFQWLILTSSNGVDFFFQRLAHHGKDARALAGLKIAVVGEKTAQSLQQHGLVADLVPPDFVADSLVAHFPQEVLLNQTRILFPRVETGGREVLVQEFTAKGAQVVEVPAYQSGCPAAIAPEILNALQTQAIDIITFASSKTVKNFCQLLEQAQGNSAWQTWLTGICLASIGPQTSKTCLEQLGRVDVEAKEYTLEGLVQAIEQWALGQSLSVSQ